MMFYDVNAFQQLYCIIFRLFDQKWNQMMVGYMGFQKVIDSVRENMEDLMKRKSIGGVPAIFDMLGIYLEDLKSFQSDADKRKAKASHTLTEDELVPSLENSTSDDAQSSPMRDESSSSSTPPITRRNSEDKGSTLRNSLDGAKSRIPKSGSSANVDRELRREMVLTHDSYAELPRIDDKAAKTAAKRRHTMAVPDNPIPKTKSLPVSSSIEKAKKHSSKRRSKH